MNHLFRSLLGAAVPLLLAACGGESTQPTGQGGTGGTTTSASGGTGGAGATGGSTTGGAGGQGGTATGGGQGGQGGSGQGGQGGSGQGGQGGSGQGGQGGTGGMSAVWPSCDSPPDGVPVRTIPEIWQQDPTVAEEVWVPGVYVTAISGGACEPGVTCQLFVQQQETFATIADGSHQALRVLIASAAAEHFTGIAVADRIDLRASVYRHTQNGENELHFHVSQALPGCAKVVGTGRLVPVAGLALEDLTVDLYEQGMGPLFIRLETVSGKPKSPTETFTLWESFMPGMGPIEEVTSVSPYFVPGHQFTGLTPDVIHNFLRVDGVFGLFAPPADPLIKYEEIYIRSMEDVEYGGQ